MSIIAIGIFIHLATQVFGDPPTDYRSCSDVLKFEPKDMVQGKFPINITGVKGISFSIGYAGIDNIMTAQSTEPANQMCKLKTLKVINRYGTAVSPTVESAQASVRSTDFNDKSIQACTGFGLCANIWDATDKDVYPISTLTYIVVRTTLGNEDCGRMRLVYDYLTWILTDPLANTIAKSQAFATMPKKVAKLAIDSILNVIQCASPDPSGNPRLLKNEPVPSSTQLIKGGGSSLQGTLQLALLQGYSGAGVSKIVYDGSLGSGGGQCLLTVGSVNCWYNTTSKRHVNCVKMGKDSSGASVCVQDVPFEKQIDFAGSDSIIQTSSLTVKEQGQRMLPVFAAAIGLMHSLPFPDLVISRQTANNIFLGNILSWNDTKIQETNPTVDFPNVHIIRLVRADSSGTTQAFVRALASFAYTDRPKGSYWNSHPLGGASLPTWPPAKYAAYNGTMQCIFTHCSRSICSPGTYLDPQLDICIKCPLGTYSDVTGQILHCTPCPKGHYSDITGAALCSKCTENSYQNQTGQVGCVSCPANTRRFLLKETIQTSLNKSVVVHVDSSATTIDDCKCLPGFWLPESLLDHSSIGEYRNSSIADHNQVVSSSHRRSGSTPSANADLSLGFTTSLGGLECLPCPQGATCPGFQDNLQTIPRPLDGYWGEPENPSLFYECKDSTSCFANYRCGVGHAQRLCRIETHGYFVVAEKWFLECPADPSAAAALTVFLTAIVIFVWLQIMRFAEGTIYDSFDVGIKFLHLIGFIAQFPLRWHPNLDYVYLVLLIANLEINFISPHCIWPTFTGATAFYFQLLVPFVIVGVATLNWYVTHRFFPSKKVQLPQAEIEPLLNKRCLRDGSISMPNWQTYGTNKALQVFAFMYQVLVFRNFSPFLCRPDPDGKTSFLYIAPDIECGTGVHISMMVTAVFYGIFVLLGFPIYMCRLLMQAKEDNLLVQNAFVMKYGTFYQAWKVDYVWWETVVLARKFCIGLILALCAVPMIQGALAILLIYVSIMVHLSASPYVEEWNNVLEIICLFCALAYTACGMIFYPSLDSNVDCVGTSGEFSDLTLCNENMAIKRIASLILILVVVLTFMLTVSSTCWELYERYLSRRTSKFIQVSQKWFGLKDRSEKVINSRLSITGTSLAALLPLLGRMHSSGSHDSDDGSLNSPHGIHGVGSLFARLRSGSTENAVEDLNRTPSATTDADQSFHRTPSSTPHVGRPILKEGSGDKVKSNKVSPEADGFRTTSNRHTRSREPSFDDTSPAAQLKAIQLRLSDMLDGYYMTSWKDMLIEMEAKDKMIKTKYDEENEASTLLDQETRYLEIDAYLPRFSCHLSTSLSNMSNSDISAVLRKILRMFPAIIDYMVTANSEARKGFSLFVKDFISYCEDRPQFVDGSGRESMINWEYRSLLADWLMKYDAESVEMCKELLDDLGRAAGLKIDKVGKSSSAESILGAMNRMKGQHSVGKLLAGSSNALGKQGSNKESIFDAMRRMRSQRSIKGSSNTKPSSLSAWEREERSPKPLLQAVVPGGDMDIVEESNSEGEKEGDDETLDGIPNHQVPHECENLSPAELHHGDDKVEEDKVLPFSAP